jgi:hypothetical protein
MFWMTKAELSLPEFLSSTLRASISPKTHFLMYGAHVFFLFEVTTA